MIKISELTALKILTCLYECKIRYESLDSSETAEGLYEEHIIGIDKAIREIGAEYDREQMKYSNLPNRNEVESDVKKYMGIK